MAMLTGSFKRLAVLDDVIRGVRYRPSTALLVAHDGRYNAITNLCEYPDRTAVLLFRGSQGHFFLVRLTDWRDERDGIWAVGPGDAMGWYGMMEVKVLTWAEAFPSVPVQEA